MVRTNFTILFINIFPIPISVMDSLPLLHGRDVFVHMATGAGKSLCMFLGPLAINESAIGMIISPLNGLMEQQVCYVDYKLV